MAAKKKAAPAAEEVQAEAEVQAPEADATQLTIADLQLLAQAIDIGFRRGAYGANESADIGAVYKKLSGFLQLIAQQQQAQGAGE